MIAVLMFCVLNVPNHFLCCFDALAIQNVFFVMPIKLSELNCLSRNTPAALDKLTHKLDKLHTNIKDISTQFTNRVCEYVEETSEEIAILNIYFTVPKKSRS